VVGPTGRVIGVDMNEEMLALARKHQKAVGDAIGWHNVEFRKGRIQDLALDLERFDAQLRARPLEGAEGFLAAERLAQEMRSAQPMVANDSMDVVVSNCVLNLVDGAAKAELFRQIHRVLKTGGRAVISDIVSDEEVPARLRQDAELWSGCISGAMTEEEFLRAFAAAGFHGIRILEFGMDPWRTVQGLEFRSMTVEAVKGTQSACLDRNQAVIYKGPFLEVLDDDQHRFERGRRVAVCDQTFRLLQRSPYREYFEFVEPRVPVALEEAKPFPRAGMRLRHSRESKGQDYQATTAPGQCCDGGSCS
jgi:SAM-dependent methyltransferase